MSDDDYLSKGVTIGAPSILSQAAPARPKVQKDKKDELFLEGYGRQWGEKTTYSVGLCYGLGIGIGSLYGSLLGLRKGGSTPKLFVNSVMNEVSSKGPYLANQGAIMTLYYVLSNQFLGWARGEDDFFNAPIAGAFSGALYKSTAGTWPTLGKYSAAGCICFTTIDQLVRNGKI